MASESTMFLLGLVFTHKGEIYKTALVCDPTSRGITLFDV